jgi:hypothetical protein
MNVMEKNEIKVNVMSLNVMYKNEINKSELEYPAPTQVFLTSNKRETIG